MRPVGHIQPRRTPFDTTQHKMAHGIEADRVQGERLLDGSRDFCEREGLQQPQYLDVLAGCVLAQPCFQRPAQLSEALRRLPAGQRCCLIQSAALEFEQCQILQRVVDRTLADSQTCCFMAGSNANSSIPYCRFPWRRSLVHQQ